MRASGCGRSGLAPGFVAPDDLVELHLHAYRQAVTEDPRGQVGRFQLTLDGGEEHRAALGETVFGDLRRGPGVVGLAGENELEFVTRREVRKVRQQVAGFFAGPAKGGVLAAIAREKPIPVYFIGVGEKLEDLETFSAREFAQALLA